MPSRAVLKKKARRAKKQSAPTPSKVFVPIHDDHVSMSTFNRDVEDINERLASKKKVRLPQRKETTSAAPQVTRPRAATKQHITSQPKHVPVAVLGETEVASEQRTEAPKAVSKRVRDEVQPADASTSHTGAPTTSQKNDRATDDDNRAPVDDNAESNKREPLTRKDRRRLETQRRLDKQIGRLTSISEHNAAPAAPGQTNTDGDATAGEAVQPPPMRHDPKYNNGTFWRDRKDKKARTLFVGNFPSSSTKITIAELVDAVVGSSEGSASVVQEVDLLPVKLASRVRHAFVTFTTKELRDVAQPLLEGMTVGADVLRANAADDKGQRAAAIAKRTGSTHLVQRRTFGGRPPMRPPVRRY